MNNLQKIHHFVLDGGPCGGKTTVLARLIWELESRGFLVFVVPEIARLLLSQKISPISVGNDRFQEYILTSQITHEKFWRDIAKEQSEVKGKDAIIFYDRGIMTSMAYLGQENDNEFFQSLLNEVLSITTIEALDRYDAVFNLVTAADGAEQFYVNDGERPETPTQARERDKRIQNVWLAHSNRFIIPNVKNQKQVTLDEKTQDVLDGVFAEIGLPAPLRFEDCYLLDSFDPGVLPEYTEIDIEQIYLKNLDGVEIRIRKRTCLGYSTYYYTSKVDQVDLQGRIEKDSKISLLEYTDLLKTADPKKKAIVKKRYSFLHNNQYFEVDVFEGNRKGLILCQRKKTKQNDASKLPYFISVQEDVSNNPRYRNSCLAEI